MYTATARCPNMNHGRSQSQIKFCPSCGEDFRISIQVKCDSEKHAARRKARDIFCTDCGVKLSTLK